MPRYLVTLPNHTIDHDGTVEITGGSLELLQRQQLVAAFGSGRWQEVVLDGKAPQRAPIPSTNTAVRALFEGDDLSALSKLARLWATDPQAAAIRAVHEALAAARAVRV